MVYKNEIGFSNIRIPNEGADLLYRYSTSNTFPEEVFVHEFLHSLERLELENKSQLPELHAYEEYNYTESPTEGLKKWYTDYMTAQIGDNKLGLNRNAYKNKPIHESCFKNSTDLTKEKFYEPNGLVEEVKALIEKLNEFINTKTEGNYNGSIRV